MSCTERGTGELTRESYVTRPRFEGDHKLGMCQWSTNPVRPVSFLTYVGQPQLLFRCVASLRFRVVCASQWVQQNKGNIGIVIATIILISNYHRSRYQHHHHQKVGGPN